jgi:putative methionine-R-sulfoxide reductase with GAF domain
MVQILCDREIESVRKRIITILLERLRHEIFPFTEDMNLSELRANLMLVQPDGQLLIAYYSGDYRAEELELKWKEGVGCCGMAWANKEEYVTDVQHTQQLPLPYREVVKHVGSVFSVPIRKRVTEGWVGVLNVDALKPLAFSHLDDIKVREIIIRYASGIGLLY